MVFVCFYRHCLHLSLKICIRVGAVMLPFVQFNIRAIALIFVVVIFINSDDMNEANDLRGAKNLFN